MSAAANTSFFRIALASLPLLFSSCALFEGNIERTPEEAARERHADFRSKKGWITKTYLDEKALARASVGNSRVIISLEDQRGLFLVNDAVAIDFPVATGRSGYSTPTGSFSILNKNRHHRSNLYGKFLDANGNVVDSDANARSESPPPGGRFVGASMPYWMRLTNGGVGLHVGYVPGGRPASHGCIRVPKTVAPKIYEIVTVGSRVKIVNSLDLESLTEGGAVSGRSSRTDSTGTLYL